MQLQAKANSKLIPRVEAPVPHTVPVPKQGSACDMHSQLPNELDAPFGGSVALLIVLCRGNVEGGMI